MIKIREYCKEDNYAAVDIWNEVVREGMAFPQDEELTFDGGREFFLSQTYTGVACDEYDNVVGLYILHPNNVGRCSHICNASYAVKSDLRGRHIGEALVKHCIETARKKNFKILQFNAVVANNKAAIHLYNKLGFKRLGTIPKGFLMKNGDYEDIIVHYFEL